MSIKISKKQLIKIIKEEYEKEKKEKIEEGKIKDFLMSFLLATGLSLGQGEIETAEYGLTGLEQYLDLNNIELDLDKPEDQDKFREIARKYRKLKDDYENNLNNPSAEEPSTGDPVKDKLITYANRQEAMYKEVLRLIKEEYEKKKIEEGLKDFKNFLYATVIASLTGVGVSGINKQIDDSNIKSIKQQIDNISKNRQEERVLGIMKKNLLNNKQAFLISDSKYGSQNSIVRTPEELNSRMNELNVLDNKDDKQIDDSVKTLEKLYDYEYVSLMPLSLSVAYAVYQDKQQGKKPRFDLNKSDLELVQKGRSALEDPKKIESPLSQLSKKRSKDQKLDPVQHAVDTTEAFYLYNIDHVLTHDEIPEYMKGFKMPTDIVMTDEGPRYSQSHMIDPEFLLANKDYKLPENGLTVEEQYKLYYLQYLTVQDLEAIDQQNDEGSEQFKIAVEILKNTTALAGLEQKLRSYGDENLPSQEYEDNPNSSLVVKSPLQEMIRKKFFFTV